MTCPHPEKHRHPSFGAALKARDALEQDRGVDIGLRPYRCDDHWHIGHSNKALTFDKWDQKMRRRARKKAKK